MTNETEQSELEKLRQLVKEMEKEPEHKSFSIYWRLLDNLVRLEQKQRKK